MKLNFRSGSALLIVLGMLSFMVVSAIGFSVFMRQNRLPSSFVRRNTTNHQLLNAALARVMNELDSAIGADPFPGVDSTSNHKTKHLRGFMSRYIDDTWKGRVFFGRVRSQYKADVEVENEKVFVPFEDTVSTLTMEGLAYLPPCLVNEARYFSRFTPTATWKTLDYDAGRYAYSAINVSDYFDLNKVAFADQRTSSPSNRVSLAYLFRSASGSPDPNAAKEFAGKIKDPIPFVSLADFNLMMYKRIGGAKSQEKYGFVSPFADYALGQGDYERYFGSVNTNYIAKTTFVTDSYFSEAAADEDILDLEDDDSQPFDSYNQRNIKEISDHAKGRDFYKKIDEKLKMVLSDPMLANLYDYLDEDSLPVSLALPSVEQVPVIAGFEIKPANAIKVKVKREITDNPFDPATTGEGNDGDSIKVTAKYTLEFDAGNLGVEATTLFPFKQARCDGFSVEAAAHIFWGPTCADDVKWNNGSCGPMRMVGSEDQDSQSDLVVHGLFTEKNKTEEGGFDEFNRYTFKTASQQISGGYADKPEDAFIKPPQLTLNGDSKAATEPFATIIETWNFVAPDKKKPNLGTWVHQGSKLEGGNGAVGLFGANHNKSVQEGASYKPYLALRLITKNNKGVVDMAPACGWDDIHNFGSVAPQLAGYLDVARSAFIIPTSGFELEYSVKGLQGLTGINKFVDTDPIDESTFTIKNVAAVCKDPRWNHNVKNWTEVDSGNQITTEIIRCFDGTNGKDRDFFQGVSDSEWLQSISELAMLPRTTSFKQNATSSSGTVKKSSGNSSDESENFAKSLPLNKKIAEARSENVYLCAADEADDKCIEYFFSEGGGGVRVNPYSDDLNIFLSALAYTPYNWGAASPDNNWTFSEAIKKTFSEVSDINSAKLSWSEIETIAGKLQDSFASSDDWVEAYNKLGWGLTAGEKDIFENYELSSADKKYLYGFWKGCFANNQQLFIVFIRAEPSVGSGSAGVGRGGRAVAVVWRDPKAPIKSNGEEYDEDDQSAPPHKMRVLFYKALE